MNWRYDAKCAGQHPDVFFEQEHERTAKAICRDCPVNVACLQTAHDEGEEFAVYGGLNTSERKAWARAWKRSRSRLAFAVWVEEQRKVNRNAQRGFGRRGRDVHQGGSVAGDGHWR